jgi:hypothetical protein
MEQIIDLDRARLVGLLRTSGATFVGSFQDLDLDQFHFKPAPDRWSVAETAEHVTLAETGSGKLLGGRLTRDPTPPEVLATTRDAEARIDARLTSTGPGFPAPEFVVPTGRWRTPTEIAKVFADSREATIRLLETSPIDFGQYAYPHVVFGPLTGYQWAYFMVRHAERHVRQIEGIKQAPGYPSASR